MDEDLGMIMNQELKTKKLLLLDDIAQQTGLVVATAKD